MTPRTTGYDLLRGKQRILNKSLEHAVMFNDWFCQKKASNTRLTLTIESSMSELTSEEASATSDMYVALVRAKIKM